MKVPMEQAGAANAARRTDRWGRRFYVPDDVGSPEDKQVMVTVAGGKDREIGWLSRWPAIGGRSAYWSWICTLDGTRTESRRRFEVGPGAVTDAFHALVASGRVKATFDR